MKKKRIGILICLPLILAAVFLLLYWFGNRAGSSESGDYSVYSHHYVMITDGGDEDFWTEVYESALEEGKERGVYVELFGANLAVDYEPNELLYMAIQASVDGIIVAGSDEEEMLSLINEAVDAGIPVVTVFNDCIESLRQCFVGCNNYNVGQEYGRQILNTLTEDSGRVLVLTDESRTDSSEDLILLAIRETLEEELGDDSAVTVQTYAIDDSRDFSAEESIRDIFLSEDLPDVLVCLNSVQTRCAYSAAVDYNRVGTVQIIGYYDSDTILDAVSKNIIQATVAPDAAQMGRLCVEAMDEYVQTGYTNGYMAVDIQVITPNEAEELMEQL